MVYSMIVNLLKIIFIYFIYRFIKVLVKGYILKKIKHASEQMNDRMRENIYSDDQSQRASYKDSQQQNNQNKTFEAEYKVLKD